MPDLGDDAQVNPLRRSGLRLAALAIACWAVLVASIVTYDPGDGVPIGAAFFYIVAVPLSVVASLLLLKSLRTTAAGAGVPTRGKAQATIAMAAGVLAVAAMVILPVMFVGGATDAIPVNTLNEMLVWGSSAFVVSTLLFGSMRP